MELIELARGTWSDALRALSRECAGGAAHIRSSGAAGSLRPTSPLNRSLQELRYDEVRREVEVSIALDRGAWPRLRCFVAEPDHIFVGRSTDGRAAQIYTDPTKSDTDGDGLADGATFLLMSKLVLKSWIAEFICCASPFRCSVSN